MSDSLVQGLHNGRPVPQNHSIGKNGSFGSQKISQNKEPIINKGRTKPNLKKHPRKASPPTTLQRLNKIRWKLKINLILKKVFYLPKNISESRLPKVRNPFLTKKHLLHLNLLQRVGII